MTPLQHYQEAERLLELADRPDNHPEGSKFYAMLGIVHALLATAFFPQLVTSPTTLDLRTASAEDINIALKEWRGWRLTFDDRPEPDITNAHIIDHHYTPGHNGMCAAGIGGGDGCGEPASSHALHGARSSQT